jgi:hypothetical protein
MKLKIFIISILMLSFVSSVNIAIDNPTIPHINLPVVTTTSTSIINGTYAGTGNCPAGQVVQNTTTGGVQCVVMSSGGNPFNQVLNTTSNVTFNNINASVTTLSGNNGNAPFSLLNLYDTYIPSPNQIGGTIDINFSFTQSKAGVISLHEAARISAYKAGDFIDAGATEIDTDSGLKFYVTNNGITNLGLILNNTGGLTNGSGTPYLTSSSWVSPATSNLDMANYKIFGNGASAYIKTGHLYASDDTDMLDWTSNDELKVPTGIGLSFNGNSFGVYGATGTAYFLDFQILAGGSYGIYADSGTVNIGNSNNLNVEGYYLASSNMGVSDTYDDGSDTQITFTGGIETGTRWQGESEQGRCSNLQNRSNFF